MAYHVTIIRTAKGNPIPITKEELINTLSTMPNTSLVDIGSGRLKLTTPISQGEMSLIWQKGEIWISNPNKEALQLMLDLSVKLNARVRGDEFETYESIERTYTHPDDEKQIEHIRNLTRDTIQKTRHNQWVLNATIACFFLILAMLVNYVSC